MVNFWTENVNKYLVRLGSKRPAVTLVFKDDDSFSHHANFLGKKIHRANEKGGLCLLHFT